MNLRADSVKVRVPSEMLAQAELKNSKPLQNSDDVIYRLPLEEYVEGVLAGEVPHGWPLEALKAQAIATRSYTLAKMKNKNFSFLESNHKDQVFSKKAKFNSLRHESVVATKGMVLKKIDGNILMAFYHSDCGGNTDSVEGVWGLEKSEIVSKDQYCPLQKENEWKFVLEERFLSKLKRYFAVSNSLDLRGIHIKEKLISGRAQKLEFQFGRDRFFEITGEDLRRVLGFNKLKSTLFQIDILKNQFVFIGVGHGHGIGLCQWGNRALAERGWNYLEILRHYYPDSIVSKVQNQ